ncbi:MAG TPA: hypothetical protein VF844_17050 [Ktedonobacteraceae bacterium]
MPPKARTEGHIDAVVLAQIPRTRRAASLKARTEGVQGTKSLAGVWGRASGGCNSGSPQNPFCRAAAGGAAKDLIPLLSKLAGVCYTTHEAGEVRGS